LKYDLRVLIAAIDRWTVFAECTENISQLSMFGF